jgi:hypothetical protein
VRTEYPCEVCGAPVFQRTARRKRFCSRACNKRYWKHARAQAQRLGSFTEVGYVTVWKINSELQRQSS